jgi:hypothetical protein
MLLGTRPLPPLLLEPPSCAAPLLDPEELEVDPPLEDDPLASAEVDASSSEGKLALELLHAADANGTTTADRATASDIQQDLMNPPRRTADRKGGEPYILTRITSGRASRADTL